MHPAGGEPTTYGFGGSMFALYFNRIHKMLPDRYPIFRMRSAFDTCGTMIRSAKAYNFKPTMEFHTARHTLYSADENMKIDSRERRERARQIPRERNPAGAQGLGKPSANVAPVAASVKIKFAGVADQRVI